MFELLLFAVSLQVILFYLLHLHFLHSCVSDSLILDQDAYLNMHSLLMFRDWLAGWTGLFGWTNLLRQVESEPEDIKELIPCWTHTELYKRFRDGRNGELQFKKQQSE